MVKLNAPAAALFNMTVKGAPAVLGVTFDGVIPQVAGAPAVQVSATLRPYPFIAVSVPFHITFWLTTVVLGLVATAIAKFPVRPVTVKRNVCVLDAGAPAVVAASVTVAGPPTGVPAAAVTVNVTVTGDEAVGLTELDGENTQAAPAGNPEGQVSVTVPAKLPAAVS
jgi:hypothetical protein